MKNILKIFLIALGITVTIALGLAVILGLFAMVVIAWKINWAIGLFATIFVIVLTICGFNYKDLLEIWNEKDNIKKRQ